MTVQEFMVKSGVPMHLKGHEFLKDALMKHIEHPEKKISAIITEVASDYKSSYLAAERDIRTAIDKGYPDMDKALKSRLFNNRDKVTTGELIRTVSYAIRNRII